VLCGTTGLGYVDAMHQNLQRVPGASVLTYYTALGESPDARRQLLHLPWSHWRDAILAEPSVPHPDLRDKLTRIDITRYGHAMAVPVPGMLGSSHLWTLLSGKFLLKVAQTQAGCGFAGFLRFGRFQTRWV
jgi:hypothetical protein